MYFKPSWLWDIGLQIQLGDSYQHGDYCVLDRKIHKDFVVLHTNGIHRVNIDYCGCSTNADTEKLDFYQQLLCAEWYPVTVLHPQMCAMFELMKLFHLLNLKGKLSTFHFYKSIRYCTENVGVETVPLSILYIHMYTLFAHTPALIRDVTPLFSSWCANRCTRRCSRELRAHMTHARDVWSSRHQVSLPLYVTYAFYPGGISQRGGRMCLKSQCESQQISCTTYS